MTTAVSIIAAGMVTPVGFNYQSSCAAIRAGISGVKQANLWDAENGEYLSAGKVNLPQWWEGIGKLADLVAPAIWECFEAAKPEPSSRIPILLGIAPHDRPHRLQNLDDEILNEVEWRLEIPRHRESRIIPVGNVSGVIGIQEAERIIGSGLAHYCVVAGVDSFLQQSVVEAYMDQRRILTKSNSNGFLPGEAGCAVLVARSGSKPKPELRILGIGFGREQATVASAEPLRGSGQIEACRKALADAGVAMHEIAYRQTDLSGEHYKFKEAMLTQGRLLRQRMEKQDISHPGEYLGEIGAAHVPCVLAMSHYSAHKEFASGRRCLCHFSGDGDDRAALVAETVSGSERSM